MKDRKSTQERYRESCRKDFWQKVFRLELEYLLDRLHGCRDVLSVGCGPAIIEGGLAERGFTVTGLDVSVEALSHAPDNVRTVAGRAEEMSFPDNCFDAVVYIAALEFLDDYRAALERTVSILRPHGIIVAMVLNPASTFVKEKSCNPGSYIAAIKHTDLKALEAAIAERFAVTTEYYLGVAGDEVFKKATATNGALCIITGTRREVEE